MEAAPKHPAAKVVKSAKPTQVKAATKPAAAKVIAAVAKPAHVKTVAKAQATKVVKSPVVAPTPVKASVAKLAQRKGLDKVAAAATAKLARAVAKLAHKKAAKVKAPLVKAAPLKGAKHATQPVAKVAAKTMKAKAAKVAAKKHARVAAKLPVSVEKKPTVSKPIAKVQVAAAKHIKVVAAVNASVAHTTPVNKTKVLDAAVVSLPMASFALDIPQGNATKPKPKFPGNATQKKAWDKKEKGLEKEIVALRARLNKVNVTPAKPAKAAKPATPAAAGTFNSHLAGNAGTHLKASTKLVAAKGPAPMEPIRQQNKPNSTWPTMASVAAPVSLHNVHSDGAPPQKNAKVMGSTFTGTPAKKVQSVMALDATVEHSVFDPAASSIPWFSQCEKWVSSFFARVFKSTGSRYPSASAISSAPHQAAFTRPAASLLDMTVRTPAQDMERTALSTKAEAQHVIALGSVWGDMEEADKTQEDEVRQEDEAERQRAVKVAPWKATKAELRGRHGPDMSAFWGTLETQDADIVKSVGAESGSEYDRLTKEQDDLVKKAAKQITKNDLHTDRDLVLKHNDPAFLSKTLQDTWASLETKDKAAERRIHDSPDLQMLQLDHKWHSLK